MKPIRFCASCAHELNRADAEGGAHCPNCGRKWYRNAAPTAGCVIVRDGRALVTVRAREPEKGRVDVPGGFLRYDEDPVAGLRREVKEELSVDIEVAMSDLVQAVPHRYGADGDWVLALGFRARLVSGEPSPSDDVADIRWVGPGEVGSIDFAWEHDRRLVRKALEDEKEAT